MSGTHLEGLEGTNPLGFLAALGIQVAFENDCQQPRLWWSQDITPHAVVDEDFTFNRIIDRALETFTYWEDSLALNPRRRDGSTIPKGDELKLVPGDIRAYLKQAVKGEPAGKLATALVAEGSLDNKGVAKPSDLYFTSGNMKFLNIVRKIFGGVGYEDLKVGLADPWPYQSTLPSLGWDVVDDRVYALRANKPKKEDKLTNPGAEALAILGMSLHPVFASRKRTLTQGFSGSWKEGHYSWPLWQKSAGLFGVKSLLAHAFDNGKSSLRLDWYRSWGVFTILRSPVRRPGEGGYGRFGPSEVVWQQVRTGS